MSGFDPGYGWRDATGDVLSHDTDRLILVERGNTSRVWVPVEPVPALPTVPYTVIRVTWNNGGKADFVLWPDEGGGRWVNSLSSGLFLHLPSITGFEVLSEPRAVTAKAVLDRVDSYDGNGVVPLVQLAREFGVEL